MIASLYSYVRVQIFLERVKFMSFFNAFQLVAFFAVGPFIITYVKGVDFYAHIVLFWVLVLAYLAGFSAITFTVAEKLEDRKKN